MTMQPPPGATNHWIDYGARNGYDFSCKREAEFCHKCGRQLIEHFELTGMMSHSTGQPTYARFHSCPTWFTGWRASRWAKSWATPGWGHDSRDADNPLSGRTYR
jgi:hypothetical protein